MQTVQIVLFSDKREIVMDATSRIKSLCETKGIEYGGPHTPPPPLNLSEQEADLADQGVSLFGEAPNEQEIEQLKGKTVFSRLFRLHRYASDEVTRKIVMQDHPDELFLRLKVRQTEFIGSDHGHAPFSYDPNIDYSGEV
ncbi:hypothetical protein D8Y22_13715 [Salinadaptatus halalkaliphilus]|uniref:Uncharacterized protein n=1 Tax=Salinadaptatus halalkaliphilus TaxID=2419781 RepID=A0A4S3TJN5_9EURY|nr:hypothetical protein [Salinadaptatus halalkaliphilus]THE64284.1 hypothetical protein D8Y22_13715 [Salinadaptatus halalkaliphilus]